LGFALARGVAVAVAEVEWRAAAAGAGGALFFVLLLLGAGAREVVVDAAFAWGGETTRWKLAGRERRLAFSMGLSDAR
jgi:hypothetical protein